MTDFDDPGAQGAQGVQGVPGGTDRWRLAIAHETAVRYDGTARASYNELRMTPQNTGAQTVLAGHVELFPHAVTWQYTDYWGTRVTCFDLQEPHSVLTIRANAVVETPSGEGASGASGQGGRASVGWDEVARAVASGELADFVTPTAYCALDPALNEEVRDRVAGAEPHEAAERVRDWIQGAMAYVPGSTGVHTRGQEAWDSKSGVCQDFSHLAIGMLRAAGLPARYVSGYLFPNPNATPGDSGEGQSHAWVEYWAGSWIGVDTTNNTTPGPRHVLVGRGRDYGDVLPHKGIYHGAPDSTLTVSVLLTRLA
jgi:transglutaminase-like putative cysteine protease